ncbi:MAG: ABC transporter ATP-binding protein [Lautropia sp.]
MTTRLLEVDGLCAGYDGAVVLAGVSLHVERGETVAVIGANGAGKTTLIRTIAAMVPATAGRVRFEGSDIGTLASPAICEAGLAQVPEGRQLFPTLSVEDNLRLGANLKRARARAAANLDRVFGLFPRLADRRRQLAGTLSGGEQQMVAIGRALMAEPVLVMFDEPSLGLSPLLVEVMFETIVTLNREGVSILLVEQAVAESLAISSRGYVLENGEIVATGSGEQLLDDDRVRRAYLGL